MTPATAANEIKSNIGPDFTLADAYDAEYVEQAEDVDLMTTEQRQALNAAMAEFYGIS